MQTQQISVMEKEKSPGIFGYYILAFKKYAQFSGRASRSEFWYFMLLDTVVYYALHYLHYLNANMCFAYSVVSCLPVLAITSRRLHDVNFSGWVQFVPVGAFGLSWVYLFDVAELPLEKDSGWFLLLCLGAIWTFLLLLVFLVFFIILLCKVGERRVNRFGAPSEPERSGNMISSLSSFRVKARPSAERLQKIEKFAALRDKGILTEAEFQKKKSEWL